MSSAEFVEWIAYQELEPFGTIRDDQRAGVIASAIVNVHKKKNARPISWDLIFPPYEQRKPSTPRTLLDKVIALNARLGGADKRKRR